MCDALLKGVLVLTGDAQPDRSESLREFSVDAILHKPLELDVLVATLRTFQRLPASDPS